MTGHLDDELSALLDGELDAAQARAAREHMATCASCSAALDQVAAARRALRALAPPPTPLDLGARIVARRHRLLHRAVLSASGGAAVLLVVAVASAPSPPSPVEPHVGTMAQMHLAHEAGAPELVRSIAFTGSDAPAMRRVEVGGGMASVFTEDGHLDTDAVEAAGEVDVGARVALVTSEEPGVVVVESGDSVLTAVADDVRSAVRALERLVGADSRSLVERAHDAAADLIGAFGFSP